MEIIDSNNCIVLYEENLLQENECSSIIDEINDVNPELKQIKIFNRLCNQHRLIKLLGEKDNLDYTYSGLTLQSVKYPKTVNLVKEKLENELNIKLPICLVNYYRNGNDYISFHSDDETDLGKNPIIISLSIGAERKFLFQNKINKKIKELILKNGSMLLMAGQTQRYWKHSLPKDKNCKDLRINLTFRNYKNNLE